MNKKTVAYLFISASLLIWGTSFLATKTLLVTFSPIEIILVRYLIAFIALFIAYPKVMKWTSWKQEMLLFLAGVTGTSIYSLMENSALLYTSASNVSIIVTTSVFFSSVIAQFFFPQEKVSKYFLAGFAVAILGITLISTNGTFELSLSPIGDLLAIGAAISWGIYSTAVKFLANDRHHSIQMTRRIMIYGVLSFLPVYFLTEDPKNLMNLFELEPILLFLALGVLSSAFTFYSWNQAVHLLGVIKTSLSLYLVPVITIIAASLLLHEQVTVMGMIGTILTLIGLFISTIRPKPLNE